MDSVALGIKLCLGLALLFAVLDLLDHAMMFAHPDREDQDDPDCEVEAKVTTVLDGLWVAGRVAALVGIVVISWEVWHG